MDDEGYVYGSFDLPPVNFRGGSYEGVLAASMLPLSEAMKQEAKEKRRSIIAEIRGVLAQRDATASQACVSLA